MSLGAAEGNLQHASAHVAYAGEGRPPGAGEVRGGETCGPHAVEPHRCVADVALAMAKGSGASTTARTNQLLVVSWGATLLGAGNRSLGGASPKLWPEPVSQNSELSANKCANDTR